MDGGRRVLKSLSGPKGAAGDQARGPRARESVVPDLRQPNKPSRSDLPPRRPRLSRAQRLRVLATRRGIGWVGAILLMGSTLAYAATLGGHWPAVQQAAFVVPDTLARAAGFKIAAINVDGRKSLTNEEILAAIDYGSGRSLLFLDASAARERLMQNPLVSDASIRKLYPDALTVTVVEREPYAMWQRDGQLVIIARDGTTIDVAKDGRFSHLPLLVGRGAETHATEILEALAPYPELKDEIYAAVRVGGRRWNIRLKNGVDVKFPAQGVAEAVSRYVALEATNKLSERDLAEIDLRFAGRTVVRISDAAAAAEAEADKKNSRRGGQS